MTIGALQHVVVGGGHFVEVGGRLVQECFLHGEQLLNVYDSIVRANAELPTLGHIPVGDPLPAITNSYSSRPPILLASDIESRAWEAYRRERIDEDFYKAIEMGKDAGLMLGSALAGDMQSAVEYGAKALEKSWDLFRGETEHAWNFGTQLLSPDRDK